ncbi:MAG: hypothetical protein HY301_02075 [Verrucomicrobia bacterium]|nr:hypothetical protein [Verrucomicrobiota bacterium]
MADETPNRSAGKADAGNVAGGGGDEHAPLQTRAAFLKNWGWELVVSYNRGACERGSAQHGRNSEAFEKVGCRWEETRVTELTLLETLDFLRWCHRAAPFLFYNGNTFAEIARRLLDVLFADLPMTRRREAASLGAHYIAGVLDREAMTGGMTALCEAADFQPGDRVRTLRGSARGVVVRVMDDGRIVWRADTGGELLALPESLLRDGS